MAINRGNPAMLWSVHPHENSGLSLSLLIKTYENCETCCLDSQKVSRSHYAITIRKSCDLVSKCFNQVFTCMHLRSD